MNTKKCHIGISNIPTAGLGLIAGEKIIKGEIVWENHPASELKYNQEQFDALPGQLKLNLRKYFYKRYDIYYLNIDDSRHYNHSDEPNVVEDEFGNYIANKDIEEGEELTCDYRSFNNDDEWLKVILP